MQNRSKFKRLPWADVQNEQFTYQNLLLVFYMNWIFFWPSDMWMLKKQWSWEGSPLGCSAKRTFHLQIFATSFANELDRCLGVRYVNAETNWNWTGSPNGLRCKTNILITQICYSFCKWTGSLFDRRSVNSKKNRNWKGFSMGCGARRTFH